MAIYFYKISKDLIKKRNLIYLINFFFYFAITITILPVFSASINLFKKDKNNNPNKLLENSFLISNIIWEKQVKSREDNSIIKWEKLPINQKQTQEYNKNNTVENQKLIINSINSLNRSIIINNEIVGPDIGWLVPTGLKWNSKYHFDSSIRGHNRRKDGQPFIGWNGGDAVAQFYYQPINLNSYSLGLNLGMRSVYEGPVAGGSTAVGEGLSMGFRIDKSLSNKSGIAFGAEQLLHFDGLTDTGRDIYFTVSKGWWSNESKTFPINLATFGFGTGKLAEGNIKGFCSDLLGGSGTEVFHQRSLCWAPIFSLARVHSSKLSTFFEYNSKWFLIGSSIAPLDNVPIRGTFALQLSDHIDNYKLKNFDELKWVFRLSLGF